MSDEHDRVEGTWRDGHAVYRAMPPTRHRRLIAIGSFLAGIAAAVGVFAAVFWRWQAAQDAVAGRVGFSALQQANDHFKDALVALIVVDVVVGICIGRWASRVVDNAIDVGVGGLDVNWAKYAWVTPVAWYHLGFRQLSIAVSSVEGRAPNLPKWQFAFIVQTSLVAATVYTGSLFGQASSATDVVDATRLQWIVAAGGVVATALTSVFAARALNEVSRAVAYDERLA